MKKANEVIVFVAGITIILVGAFIINDHLNVKCLFGHCLAVLK